MEWQKVRPARKPFAPFVNAPRAAFALAALALSALFLGCLAASSGLTAAVAQERFEGQWLVEFKPDGKVSLTMRYRESRTGDDGRRHESSWDTTHGVEPDKLQGLAREQVFSAAGTNVRFELRRDAGAFVCEGWFKQGNGSGHFTFVPDRAFAAELSRRGVGNPEDRQLFSLARADVGLALLDEIKSQGYERPTLEQLVRVRDHGVTVEYVRELKGLGYTRLPVEDLVRLRDHGVTASFIRRVKERRSDTPAVEELINLRDRGSY